MCKSPVLIIFMIQSAVMVLVALALGYGCGATAERSAVLGGALYILPASYFGLRVFHSGRKAPGAHAAQRMVAAIYRAESGKFVLTVVGFALVFSTVRPLNAAVLFGSYGLCVVLQWVLVARLVK